MSNKTKFLLLLFVVLYWISPIDLAPGFIDDIIVTVIAMIVEKRREAIKG